MRVQPPVEAVVPDNSLGPWVTAAALVLQSALSEWSAGDVAQRPGNLRLVVPLMSVNLVCGWLHASFSWKFAVTVVVESLTFSRDLSVNRRDVAPLKVPREARRQLPLRRILLAPCQHGLC